MRGLPDATRVLFERIKNVPGIEDFFLVGGTALALRLGHRLSEDLDFLTTSKLDKDAIARFLNAVHQAGAESFRKTEAIGTRLQFDMDGADADDYSQTWRVDGVKLQFFVKTLPNPTAQAALEARLAHSPVEGIDGGRIRIATEACIFSLKAQLVQERLTSRDLFDIRTLLQSGRFTFEQLLSEASSLGANPDFIKERIAIGRLRANDPVVNLPTGEAMEITQTRAWLIEQINEYERQLAAEACRSPDAGF